MDWSYLTQTVGQLIDGLLAFPIYAFQNDEHFAQALASTMVVATILVLSFVFYTHYLPYHRAIHSRLSVLKSIIEPSSSHDEARERFFKSFVKIDAAMLAPAAGHNWLPHTWTEFKETWVDQHQEPIKNTTRAIDHFGSIPLGTTWLNFWANTFVGLGLLFTFIGIIAGLQAALGAIDLKDTPNTTAALNGIKQTAHQGADTAAAMNNALKKLLSASTAKFYTSIAGLGAAISIRLCDRIFLSKLQREIGQLCELIERGLAYTPVQSISINQLKELQEQTSTLKRFSTDLAVSIGDRMQQAMQPLVEATNSVGSSLSGLATLGDTLKTVGSAVQGGGEDAANQIRMAAAVFSEAAGTVKASLDSVVSQVQLLSTEMADTHTKANEELFSKLKTSLERLEKTTDGHAERLDQAVQNIGTAGEKTSEKITQSIALAAKSAGRVAAEQVREVTKELSDNMKATTAQLKDHIEQSVLRITQLNQTIEKQISHFIDAAKSASELNKELTQTTKSFQDIARPFVASAEKLSTAANNLDKSSLQIQAAIQAASTSLSLAADKAAQASKSFEITQQGTTAQWQEYSRRFADIDKSVTQVVKGITEQFEGSLGQLVDHAGKIDSQFANATKNLSSSVAQLKDFAEELEDIARKLESKRS